MRLPNYLFVKLLLAFWITSSLVVGMVIGLPYLQQNLNRQAIEPAMERVLERTASKLEGRPSQALGHLAKKRHGKHGSDRPWRVFLLDSNGQPLPHQPPPSREVRRFLLDLPALDTAEQRQFRHHLVIGPRLVQLQDQTAYLVIQGKSRGRHHWLFALLDRPLFLLLSAVVFSGLVFGLLAWHLGKPLRQLEDTARQLALGELDARVDPATSNRRDELGQLARHFNTMADALNTMIAGQRRLLSDISHELRTPLTRLQLALALARKKRGDGVELQRIGREAEQMDAMMAELLDLARLENQWDQPMIPLDLASCLAEVIEDARFEAEQLGKALEVELPTGILLPLREGQLQRAVENVLRNALKYADSKVSLHTSVSADQVVLTIRDDGPGVPPNQLENLFKPFYRADDARSRDAGGWGLGLAITEAAIAQHRGSVSASQAEPSGLAIQISLPKSPSA